METISVSGAEIHYYRSFLPAEEGDGLVQHRSDEVMPGSDTDIPSHMGCRATKALGAITCGKRTMVRLGQLSAVNFSVFRCVDSRRSAAWIMVETSVEKALARSASVRRVGLLAPRSSWPM